MLTKIVNGIEVALSVQEEADLRAEWAASDAALTASLPEKQRKADIETAIASDATIQLLKAMSVAEFDTWWTANVTNLAQANNILKRLTRLAIRRLL